MLYVLQNVVEATLHCTQRTTNLTRPIDLISLSLHFSSITVFRRRAQLLSSEKPFGMRHGWIKRRWPGYTSHAFQFKHTQFDRL